MKRLWLLFGIGLLLTICIGCSGGGNGSLLMPQVPGDEPSLPESMVPRDNQGSGHVLWGYWQCMYDLESNTLDIVPLRGVMLHVNAARFLQDPNFKWLSIKVNSFKFKTGIVDCDVTLSHPFPYTDLRGFDVRGIFMGPGDNHVAQTDPGIVYPSVEAGRLLNPDGYTRWWNAVEFTTPGIFGYDDDRVVPGFLVPTSTLNPYKYFADPLSPSDPVVPGVNPSNRGTFSTDLPGNSVTRKYIVRLPRINGKLHTGFHYAVDACWGVPKGPAPTPKPVDEYPMWANCPEPFHIEVNTDASTVWYVDSSSFGGEINVSIEVFDWRAGQNPDGILGEVDAIWMESPTLIDTYYASSLEPQPGSQPTSAIFNFTIPNAHPTAIENQELLVTVRSKKPNTYAQPFTGAAYPQGAVLAAYKLVEVPILAYQPVFIAIKVESPNGGEVWPVSSAQTVKWDWSGVLPQVDIDLSLDAGVTYDHPLASGITNTGEFTIDPVPNLTSTQAKVRVASTDEPDIFDESDEVFIVKPTTHVDTPNGGELIIAGTATSIKWTASDTIANVSILLSVDSGQSYMEPLTLSTPNTGEFIWQYVSPNFIGDKCRVQILDVDDPLTLDTSDADFTILPETQAPITVLVPNGGEVYKYGDPAEITWGADPAIPDVSIWLSTDSGQNYTIEVVASTPNDGGFTLPCIPQDAEGEHNRIRVADASSPLVWDESDNDFTVLPSVTVTTPNGGELWIEGNVHKIDWDASASIDNIAILLSNDSGLEYIMPVVLSTPNTGCYMWYITPGIETGSHFRVKILDVDNYTVADESDDDFTIFPESMAPINIIKPNGGEMWVVGTMEEITWQALPSIENLKIELSINGGMSYGYVIVDSTPNYGTFIWDSIPDDVQVISDFARIKISDVDNPTINDSSNESFQIKPPGIYIEYPNGGEVLGAGLPLDILWNASESIEFVQIDLIHDYEGTPVIIPVAASVDASFDHYHWPLIPDEAIGTSNRMRIKDITTPSISDVSDQDFEVQERTMQITNPLGGETWRIGCNELVEWSWCGDIPHVDIMFTPAAGGGDKPIAINVDNDGAYETLSFEPPWLKDQSLWTPLDLVLEGAVGVYSSANPLVFSKSGAGITIYLTQGIANLWNVGSSSPDTDGDGIKDDVEAFIGTDPDQRDTDMDGLFDNIELFWAYNYYNNIPDEDHDGVISPIDNDDNGDGKNDGDQTDSDNDGIPNYLEYYGYTYNWMSDSYSLWDGENYDELYYKTDPMQPSTDQDPYSDGMETSGKFMDVSVRKPGDLPMVPAYPNIVVKLEGYSVTLNQDITYREGEFLQEGKTWNRQTIATHTSTMEHSWEFGVAAELELGFKTWWHGATIKTHADVGGTYGTTNTNTRTSSTGGSVLSRADWSRTTSMNPMDAARIKLFLKAYNYGTSCASNIVPTLTLKIGGASIATFQPGGTQINLLEPGGQYPSQPGTYWVIDSIGSGDPLKLTLDELRAIECGAPVSVVLTQVEADVMLMNEYGQWVSVGQWDEYIARCAAACANMYLELDEGEFLHYLIYADDTPSSPVVLLEDALIWAAGGGSNHSTDCWVTYFDKHGIKQTASLWDWEFAVDPNTLTSNGVIVPPVGSGQPLLFPPEFNLGDLVLNPDTIIIGKIPRPPSAGGGPAIYYAYLDEELDYVRTCASDYNGIAKMEFVNKNGTVFNMEEMFLGAGVFSLYIDPAYESDGTEVVKAYSVNPNFPNPTVLAVEKVIYPEEPVPEAPIVSTVLLDIPGHYFYANAQPGENSPPLAWVRAYHDSFDEGYIEMAPIPDAYKDPYGWEVDLPCTFGMDDLLLVAFVQAGIYTEKLPTKVIRALSEGNGIELISEHDWTAADSWYVQGINLDTADIITVDKDDEGDWNDDWNPDPTYEFWIRWDDRDSDDGGQKWRMYFNHGYVKNPVDITSDPEAFICLTRDDICGYSYDVTQACEFAKDDNFAIKTSLGNFSKVLITVYETYDPGYPGGDNRGLRIQLNYLTFRNP